MLFTCHVSCFLSFFLSLMNGNLEITLEFMDHPFWTASVVACFVHRRNIWLKFLCKKLPFLLSWYPAILFVKKGTPECFTWCINVLLRHSYVLLWNTCNVKAASNRYSFWPIFNWVKDNVISPAYLTDLMIVIWRKSQEILVRKSPQIIQAMKCCTAQMTCLSKKQGLGITCSSDHASLRHHWIFLIWGTDNQNVLFTFLYMSLLPEKCPCLGATRFSGRH